MIDKIYRELAETAINAVKKQFADLTMHEKLCIAITAGSNFEFSEVGIRLKNPVVFSEIDGKIVIFERVGS